MKSSFQEIGRNVRNYRMKKKLNQKELAELVTVSDQHISHIGNAHTKLRLPTLAAIANALGTDCNSLLGVTLVGSRKAVLHEKLISEIEQMNSAKLDLLIKFCDLLTEYDFN